MSKEKKRKKYVGISRADIIVLAQNPKVPNKYNLTPASIKSLKIGDTSKICAPLFWRNDIIKAWCIGYDTEAATSNYMSPDTFWIGFYDDNKFDFFFTAYAGMFSYEFEGFYKLEEIESLDDFIVQEKFLETINHLIDEGILIF